MKGHLPFQKALPTVCVGRVFQLVEKRGYAASKGPLFHILARFLCSKTGYPALMASRTEPLALLFVPHLEDPKALHGHLSSVV